MKRLLVVAGLLAMLACREGTAPTAAPAPTPTPTTGKISFRLDAQTCTEGGEIEFWIGPGPVFTQSLQPGQESQDRTVEARAQVTTAIQHYGAGYIWPVQSVTVPAGGSAVRVLVC